MSKKNKKNKKSKKNIMSETEFNRMIFQELIEEDQNEISFQELNRIKHRRENERKRKILIAKLFFGALITIIMPLIIPFMPSLEPEVEVWLKCTGPILILLAGMSIIFFMKNLSE